MSILSELTKLKLLRKVSKIPYWAIQITIGACDYRHMKSLKSVPTPAQLRSTWWGWKYPDRIAQHSCQSWGWNYPPPTKARHHQLRLSYSEFLNYPLQNLKTVLTKRKYPRVDTFWGAIIRGGLALPHWGCISLSSRLTTFGQGPPAVIQRFAIPTICYPISREYNLM